MSGSEPLGRSMRNAAEAATWASCGGGCGTSSNAQSELQERLLLLHRPWLDDFTHWSGSEGDPSLHGYLHHPRAGNSTASPATAVPAAGQTNRARVEGSHLAE
jgi:hypothetical protein